MTDSIDYTQLLTKFKQKKQTKKTTTLPEPISTLYYGVWHAGVFALNMHSSHVTVTSFPTSCASLSGTATHNIADHELSAVLARVPQARVTIRPLTSDFPSAHVV